MPTSPGTGPRSSPCRSAWASCPAWCSPIEFGTNWSELSRLGGNVIGPLMSYEVLTAFFLEAGFLGIMLFGRERVPKAVHLFATAMVALGTLISAFWILSANSWMQTPAGYTAGPDGVLHVADWWQVIFNPSFPTASPTWWPQPISPRPSSSPASAPGTSCAGGASPHGRIMLGMGLSLLVWLAPLQVVLGDLHGLNSFAVPAGQGCVRSKRIGRPGARCRSSCSRCLILKAETNHFELAVPKLGSLILTHDWNGEVAASNPSRRRTGRTRSSRSSPSASWSASG